MKTNNLIILEGPSGCGKTTLAQHLKIYIEDHFNIPVDYFHCNHTTQFGKEIEALIKRYHPSDDVSARLYSAILFHCLEKLLFSSMLKEHFIILDRFSDSTQVYQNYRDLELEFQLKQKTNGFRYNVYRIFVNTSPEQCYKNIETRDGKAPDYSEIVKIHKKYTELYDFYINCNIDSERKTTMTHILSPDTPYLSQVLELIK